MSMFKRWFGRNTEPNLVEAPAPAIDGAELDELRRLIDSGDLAVARQRLDATLDTHPEVPELLLLSARVHRLLGQPARGLPECELALPLADDPGAAQLELAECQLGLSDLYAAIDSLHVAVTLDAENGRAWLLLGESLRKLQRDREAQDAYRQAIRTLESPAAQSHAWFQLGQSLMYTVDVELAEAAFRQSLELQPDRVEAMVGLGNTALWQDDEPQAVRYFEDALRLSPRPGRLLLLNLGSALQNCGRFDEARRLFAQVVAEHPNDHAARWYMCQLDLALCRWSEGWSNFPARFRSGALSYRPMPFAAWDGREAPDDTLLILADEGIGDEIMYASCFSQASARVKHVIVECEQRLQPIFARSFQNVSVVGTRRENDPSWLAGLPTPQWQIAAGDLCAIFRRSDADFPEQGGYLQADPNRIAFWRDRLTRDLGPGLKVGLSWRGGTVKTRARARTLQPEHWSPILSLPGVKFVNLQYGDYAAELTALNVMHGSSVHDYPEAIADYDETAALVSALDLVITVCTAIVHLTGALGKPVWVLTPLAPGWRYTAQREQMPWYPSSRVFRQSNWGEWPRTCQEVSLALQGLTNSVGTSSTNA